MSTDAVFWLDEQGRVTDASAPALAFTGRTAGQVLGTAFTALVPPADLPAAQRVLAAALAGESPEHRFAVATPGGAVRRVPGRVMPIRAAGRVVGVQVVVHDPADRHHDEEELRVARREAEDAIRATSQLLATLSHEVRTPMSGVLGMLDLLLTTSLDERQWEYATAVHRSGERLLDVVNDILDLARLQAGRLTLEKVDFDLGALIAETAAQLSLAAERKGLAFGTEIRLSLESRYVGDPARLSQVLTHLLGHAVTLGEEGGVRLVVDSTDVEDDDRVLVRFAVAETRDDLDPAEPVVLGTFEGDPPAKYDDPGLGLELARRLLHLMGGRVAGTDRPGAGSELVLEVPLRRAPETLEPAASPGAEPLPAASHDARILLVEDNGTNQQVATLMLRGLGYTVDLVEDGAAAVEAVAARAYDLVLMDVHMPVMDGLEATRRIRAHDDPEVRDVRIVAMTAGALKGDRERAIACGMDDYLVKPVRYEDLAETVHRWTAPPASSRADAVEPASDVPASADVLDADVVATLRGLGRAAPEGFLARLMTAFVDETTTQLTVLETALAAGDAEQARHVAHSLKGSSASMGADALRRAFLAVEERARDGDLAGAAERAACLRDEYDRALAALEVELGAGAELS